MQNLFISKEDEFKIEICVAIDKDGVTYCDISRDVLLQSISGFVDISMCEIKDYNMVFKKPSFGDMVGMYNPIFIVDGEYIDNSNQLSDRYKKIILLIRRWNLTKDGSFKKPTEEEIKNLHPLIANTVGIQLDQEVGNF